jgi:hypothetical protein
MSAVIHEFVGQVKQKIAAIEDNRSPVEKLLDEHLNDNMTGIPTSVLNDFASRTHNPVDITRILRRIWCILHNDIAGCPNLLKKVYLNKHA